MIIAIHTLLPFLVAIACMTPGDQIARSNAVTVPADVQALMQIKASLDPVSIHPSSCLSTWDFAQDPCDSLHGAVYFTCGFECHADANGSQHIRGLKLDMSGYHGTLSPSIGALTSLQFLQITGNLIAGPIPSSIGQLIQLTVLDLSSNSLSGSIPESLGLLRSLQTLNLADNALQGVLPLSLKNLTGLVELRTQDNKLNGPLLDLRSFEQLQILDLSNNMFSGSLPAQLPPNLILTSLRGNQLSSGLTRDHVNGLNSVVNVLDLSSNRLSGSIDSLLFRHPSLQQLNLSHNNFTGIGQNENSSGVVLASEIIVVDISYNQITGTLPTLLPSLNQLSSLTLSHNSFGGEIPQSYGLKAVAGIKGLKPLARLLLDGNYLTGPLPAPFMTLSPGNIVVSLVDNCLGNCSSSLFFCQGGTQKPQSMCSFANDNERR